MADSSLKSLERRLNLSSLIAISISAMLGSGIFLLPGLAMLKTGPSLWLAYLVAGLCVLPAALSKAELATAMPTSGGTYVYLNRSFGPLVGTISGVGLWLSLLLKSAFALDGFSEYLLVIANVPIRPTAIVLLVGITLLNLRGVTKVSGVQFVVVVVALTSLLALCIGGAFKFESHRLGHEFPFGAWGFVSAVGFVFVSFAGVTKIAAIAEEVRDPERNLPIGILVSLAIVTAIYVGVTLMLVGVVPADKLAGSYRPIYDMAVVLSDWRVLGIAVAVLGVVTMTSMANAGLLAASRFPFAMSRDNLLPQTLRLLHSRYLTPVFCIVSSSLAMALAILLLDIEGIAKLASVFMIMMYMLENLTVIVLRETRVQWYQPGFHSPLYPWVQLFGVVSGAVLLVALGMQTLIATVVLGGVGGLLYLGYGRGRTEQVGVLSQRGPRRQLLSSSRTDIPVVQRIERVTQPVGVVVALFGDERSPEMLVDVARRLNTGGDRILVASIIELPEQTVLDAIDEESPRITSLRRRITGMASELELPLTFEAITSHDLVRTVSDLTTSLRGRWLVMEWGGRRRHTVTIGDPLGWLKNHLSCNLADFHDAGVRYIKKILVHVEPGPHDALVIGTADHMAAVHDATLTFVRFVPYGADVARLQSEGDYLDQVHSLTDAASDTLIVRGRHEATAVSEASAAFDLLITGGSTGETLWGKIRGSRVDRITEGAMCSVLRVQAPPGSSHEAFVRYQSKEERREDSLVNFIVPSCIDVRFDAGKKDTVFEHAAQSFADAFPELERKVILAALWERERTQNTALGHGMALPHATIAEAETTHLGVFTTSAPIACDAPDGQDVDVFFVTMGPPSERNTHLQMLGSLARLMVTTELLVKLRAATTADEVLVAISAAAA